MIEIIPAVLLRQKVNLDHAVELFAGLAPRLHVDIADGIFVPYTTWNNPEELPSNYFKNMPFEVHLMVSDPEVEVERWLGCHPSRIIFHRESVEQPGKLAAKISATGTETVLAYNIETNSDEEFEGVSAYQFMGIDQVGKQGGSFNPKVIEKIAEYKKKNQGSVISIDGGIKKEHIQIFINTGVNRIVVGSAIMMADNPKEAYREFVSLTNR